MSDDVQILIDTVSGPRLSAERLREVLGTRDDVVTYFDGQDPGRLRICGPDLLDRDPDEHAPFEAMVFDPHASRTLRVRGHLDRLAEVEVEPSPHVPNPSRDELVAAAAVLRADADFPAGDDVVVYASMPPRVDLDLADGSVVRRPTLGVYQPSGSPKHRVVAIDLASGTVDWAPEGVADPTDEDCEAQLPPEVDPLPADGGPDKVRVRVIRGGSELWSLVVVRPRDSEPRAREVGSGVELRQVRHRGRLVLSRAHVPILNVQYHDGSGTTFRDWQHEETRFMAAGSDPVGPGFRLCSRPPATILESGTDAGNFQGVAFHYDGGELRIVSEVQAGWYRYVSDWRLRDDGVIKPRYGFAGIRNPMTCKPHTHHAYWRFDFGIDGAGSDIVEQLGPVAPGDDQAHWTKIAREVKRRRLNRPMQWRVRDKSTGHGYRIVPGLMDGTADAWGVADVWLLKYRPSELDDGDTTSDKAELDKYLTRQSIDGVNLVMWYAGHFRHDQHAREPHLGHIVGPDLIPL